MDVLKRLRYIVDVNGNYYRVNNDDQLVVAKLSNTLLTYSLIYRS